MSSLQTINLSITDWFFEVRDNFAVRLQDIIELPVALPFEYLFIDRNFLDLCETQDGNFNVATNINNFYRGSYRKYHPDTLKGLFTWYPMDNDTECHQVPNWEWHVREFGSTSYYPLRDDKLNIYCDDIELMEYPEEYTRALNSCRHYTQLDLRSLVGWRGMMIPLDKIHLLPNINMIDNE
jgi:hypothetical protein